VIIFGLVLIKKKNNQTEKKNTRNRTETGPNRPVSVRFLMPKIEKTYMHFWAFFGFVMGFVMSF
jgi:hypothetical protein